MHIETIDRRKIDEPTARVMAELLCVVWPKPGRTVETRVAEMVNGWKDYRGPESQFPRSFLIRENGRAIAHAGIVPRTIRTGAAEFTIAGLTGVCTDPAARGRGLGELLAREAFKTVDDGTFPFSLFQTNHAVRPFYEKLGARAVDNRFFYSLDDATKSPFWDEVVMVYPGDRPWPSGEIDLHGPGY